MGNAVAERDEKIAALEEQVAEASKNAETAEQLRGEIAELKASGFLPAAILQRMAVVVKRNMKITVAVDHHAYDIMGVGGVTFILSAMNVPPVGVDITAAERDIAVGIIVTDVLHAVMSDK